VELRLASLVVGSRLAVGPAWTQGPVARVGFVVSEVFGKELGGSGLLPGRRVQSAGFVSRVWLVVSEVSGSGIPPRRDVSPPRGRDRL